MSRLVPWTLAAALFTGLVTANGLAVAEDARPLVASQEPTPEMEAIGAAAQHPAMLARFGGEYRDGNIGAYVTAVGDRVVRSITGYEVAYQFHFYVLDNSEVFAFALPGGYVYVSRALLAVANDESEVAAVLAHEISHVILRHGARRSQFAAERPATGRSEAAAAMHAFTTEQEFEADAVGVRLIAAAGYDPTAQARFLNAIEAEGNVAAAYGMAPPAPTDATHPDIPDRVAAASRVARSVVIGYQRGSSDSTDGPVAGYLTVAAPRPQPWFTGRTEFLNAIDGMIFGRRPAEGMVQGARFVDTTGRYTFDLPPGFHFTRSGRTIVAEGPDGAGMRFDGQTTQKPQPTDMADYLRRNTGSELKFEAVWSGVSDGVLFAKARARMKAEQGGGSILLAAIRVTDNTVFRFQFFVPESMSEAMIEEVWGTPQSFRRISADEVKNWQPLRLRVYTADEAMPLEAVAAQMRVVEHPLAWLAALNQVSLHHTVANGERLKVIAP